LFVFTLAPHAYLLFATARIWLAEVRSAVAEIAANIPRDNRASRWDDYFD